VPATTERAAALYTILETAMFNGLNPEVYLADVARYLQEAIRPWLEHMGFAVASYPNR
jgi:hypothetical protein